MMMSIAESTNQRTKGGYVSDDGVLCRDDCGLAAYSGRLLKGET
jgi:hypothetical protein